MNSPQPGHRTSGWPPTKNEWIGFFFALALATAVFVLLGWYGVLR